MIEMVYAFRIREVFCARAALTAWEAALWATCAACHKSPNWSTAKTSRSRSGVAITSSVVTAPR